MGENINPSVVSELFSQVKARLKRIKETREDESSGDPTGLRRINVEENKPVVVEMADVGGSEPTFMPVRESLKNDKDELPPVEKHYN